MSKIVLTLFKQVADKDREHLLRDFKSNIANS